MENDGIGMLDEIIAWRVQAKNKQRVGDEFSEACDALVKAERKFNKLDATVRTDSSADVCKWFDALEERYLAEKRVWQLFTAGERSRRMGMLYLRFRESLFTGLPLRADA
jgi:hypothetical protein